MLKYDGQKDSLAEPLTPTQAILVTEAPNTSKTVHASDIGSGGWREQASEPPETATEFIIAEEDPFSEKPVKKKVSKKSKRATLSSEWDGHTV